MLKAWYRMRDWLKWALFLVVFAITFVSLSFLFHLWLSISNSLTRGDLITEIVVFLSPVLSGAFQGFLFVFLPFLLLPCKGRSVAALVLLILGSAYFIAVVIIDILFLSVYNYQFEWDKPLQFIPFIVAGIITYIKITNKSFTLVDDVRRDYDEAITERSLQRNP